MTSSSSAHTEPPRSTRRSVDDIRAQATALVAEKKTDEAVELLLSALAAVLDNQRHLELLVAKLRRAKFGQSSERVDPTQLLLLFEESLAQNDAERAVIDASAESAENEALTREIEAAKKARQGDRKKRKKRVVVGANVAREKHDVAVADAERRCPGCGDVRKEIGHDPTRRLEYVPGHFVEHEYRLEKIACPRCKDALARAEAPIQVLPRSQAGASLLGAIIVGKVVDHAPLHRQARGFRRSGVDIPESTLSDWLAGVGDLVAPVVDALAERVLSAKVVRADGTGLPVLDPTSPKNIVRGTVWAYVGDDRDVLFRYAPNGSGKSGPLSFLSGHEGYVLVDAASVFDRLFKGESASAIEVNCLAHGRRKLEALLESDPRVAYPLELIARLYRIEELADLQGLSPPERTEFRGERSKPVLDKLKGWLTRTVEGDVPSAAITKAAQYFLNHWTGLTRFVDDGILPLDNNVCEQQIRDIALGRKNYLFAGSHDSAVRLMGLYSLARTCAQHGVPPLPFFTDVLVKLASGWPKQRMAELLPDRWHAAFGASTTTPEA